MPEVELTDLFENFPVKNDALLVFIFDIKVNSELFQGVWTNIPIIKYRTEGEMLWADSEDHFW